jgi:hypothetical protein
MFKLIWSPTKKQWAHCWGKNEFHCIKPIIFFLLILFTLSNLETGRQFFIPSLILIDFPEQSWCIAFSSLLSTSIQFYFIKSSKAKQIIIIISKEYNECVWIAIYEQYNECFPFQFIIYASWSTISGVVFPFSFFVKLCVRDGVVAVYQKTTWHVQYPCWKIIHEVDWINKDT